MGTFSLFFIAEVDNYSILIDGIKFELYQGTNKKPCYFKDNKYNYLNSFQSSKLNELITTVKAV